MAVRGGHKFERKLREMLEKLNRPGALRVGFLENAKYPDGTPVAAVAAWNNYGTGRAPPRPFFSNFIAENQGTWPDDIAKLLKRTDYDADQVLRLMGERMKGQLQKSIRELMTPPLAPSTIKAKGFDKPLIHHSIMINSVDYAVAEKDKTK